jgi:hypothetical protein
VSYFVVDVEADGPIPGDFSMVQLGCVMVEPGLTRTFRADLKPVSDRYAPQALAVCGLTREQTLAGEDPAEVMQRFDGWITGATRGRPVFVSDNNGFDWMFVCWYFHHFLGRNPFGFSSVNLGSLYKGMARSMRESFKHLRKTVHTHDPLDDARGNAEALLEMKERLGLEIEL